MRPKSCSALTGAGSSALANYLDSEQLQHPQEKFTVVIFAYLQQGHFHYCNLLTDTYTQQLLAKQIRLGFDDPFKALGSHDDV